MFWVIIVESGGKFYFLLDQENFQVMAFARSSEAYLTFVPSEVSAEWTVWREFLNPRCVLMEGALIFDIIGENPSDESLTEFQINDGWTVVVSPQPGFDLEQFYVEGDTLPLIVTEDQRRRWQDELTIH